MVNMRRNNLLSHPNLASSGVAPCWLWERMQVHLVSLLRRGNLCPYCIDYDNGTSQEMSTDSDKSVEFPFNFNKYDTIIFCDQKPTSSLILMVPGKWCVRQLVCGNLHNFVWENASCACPVLSYHMFTSSLLPLLPSFLPSCCFIFRLSSFLPG